MRRIDLLIVCWQTNINTVYYNKISILSVALLLGSVICVKDIKDIKAIFRLFALVWYWMEKNENISISIHIIWSKKIIFADVEATYSTMLSPSAFLVITWLIFVQKCIFFNPIHLFPSESIQLDLDDKMEDLKRLKRKIDAASNTDFRLRVSNSEFCIQVLN